jgi:hypothetical protein
MGMSDIPIRDIAVHRTHFAEGLDHKDGLVGGFCDGDRPRGAVLPRPHEGRFIRCTHEGAKGDRLLMEVFWLLRLDVNLETVSDIQTLLARYHLAMAMTPECSSMACCDASS